MCIKVKMEVYNNVNVYVYTFYTYTIFVNLMWEPPQKHPYLVAFILLRAFESLRRMQCDHCHARLGPEGRDEFVRHVMEHFKHSKSCDNDMWDNWRNLMLLWLHLSYYHVILVSSTCLMAAWRGICAISSFLHCRAVFSIFSQCIHVAKDD